MIYLAVGLGSAAGGVLRFAISTAMANAMGGVFPWWTLLVNVAGCFVIGYVASMASLPPIVRGALIPGLCGGFTTFSAFSLETIAMWRSAETTKAVLYTISSLLLCLAATVLGHRVSR